MNESDVLAALAAETGVLKVHEQDVEFLKAGELYRCRMGLPGESVGGFCAERSPGLVIVTFCRKGGVCRRLVDSSSGDRRFDETRHALPVDEAWFTEHPSECYRARPLPPFQGPDLSADERARRLVVVERDQHVVPVMIALDCEEVCQ